MHKKTATLFFMAILAACSSQNSDPVVQAQVSTVLGHSHPVSIRFADLELGQDRFILEESASHRHELLLDAEKRSLLHLHIPVTATSSETDGHQHSVGLIVADE